MTALTKSSDTLFAITSAASIINQEGFYLLSSYVELRWKKFIFGFSSNISIKFMKHIAGFEFIFLSDASN